VAETEKLGGVGVVTTRLTDAVRDRGPLVPVIVSGYVPAGVVAVVVTDMVELPVVVTDGGLNVAPAPVGRPLTLNVTVPVKAFV
jgi:hypothetical protein